LSTISFSTTISFVNSFTSSSPLGFFQITLNFRSYEFHSNNPIFLGFMVTEYILQFGLVSTIKSFQSILAVTLTPSVSIAHIQKVLLVQNGISLTQLISSETANFPFSGFSIIIFFTVLVTAFQASISFVPTQLTELKSRSQDDFGNKLVKSLGFSQVPPKTYLNHPSIESPHGLLESS
jgi:hypothetical protein